jgi:hypothetical protein
MPTALSLESNWKTQTFKSLHSPRDLFPRLLEHHNMYPTSTQKAHPKRADSPQQASATMNVRVQHPRAGLGVNLFEQENRRAVRLGWS